MRRGCEAREGDGWEERREGRGGRGEEDGLSFQCWVGVSLDGWVLL